MKNEIISNLDQPHELERLYRKNKQAFKATFIQLYPEIKNQPSAEFWNERLQYESEEISWGSSKDILFVLLIAFTAGLIAKIPALYIDHDFYYTRNLGFIVFPILSIYFAKKNNTGLKTILTATAITLLSVFYINSLPDDKGSNTLVLACLHLPFILWTILGVVFTGSQLNFPQRRIEFLRYNGDLVVMSTLIGIAGVLLVAISIGLFHLIGFNIEKFYSKYVVVFGAAAVPVIATYITQTNPQLVSRISPIIARLFSPLVLITLIIYLIAILYSGKDPYNDRQFLITFNSLLVGVMAIILFSVAESSRSKAGRGATILLLLLSLVTTMVCCIALSAIIFRISSLGITPNRMAVLGGDFLIFIHLILVSRQLFKAIKKPEESLVVETAIAMYLPIYSAWTVIVTFLFPFIFQFR